MNSTGSFFFIQECSRRWRASFLPPEAVPARVVIEEKLGRRRKEGKSKSKGDRGEENFLARPSDTTPQSSVACPVVIIHDLYSLH